LDGTKAENPDLKIFYMDESFFRSETPTTHTWGDKKDRKTIQVSSHRGTVAVVGATEIVSGEHLEWIYDGVDSRVIRHFLSELSKKYPDETIAVVLDNASYHKAQGNNLDFPLSDNISLLFLPPYSPDLNYQENVWKVIKESEFKNKLAKDINELYELVESTLRAFAHHKFIFS